MMIFETRRIREAKAHAVDGGQALHMMTGQWAQGWPGPRCFQRATEFAHLFDQNRDRLVETARRLGVRRIVVSKSGTPYQHIDLCGRPLTKAKAEAAEPKLPMKETGPE